MDIYLESRHADYSLDDPQTEAWQGRIQRLLDAIGAPAEAEVSVLFVSDEEIRELNKEYRGFDKSTDVLSFPQEGFPQVEGMPHPLGDIVISIPTARKQAEELGQSLERELTFLVIHGLLHLTGLDHQTPEEEETMTLRQRELLEQLEGAA